MKEYLALVTVSLLVTVVFILADFRAQYVCNSVHPSWVATIEWYGHECVPPEHGER